MHPNPGVWMRSNASNNSMHQPLFLYSMAIFQSVFHFYHIIFGVNGWQNMSLLTDSSLTSTTRMGIMVADLCHDLRRLTFHSNPGRWHSLWLGRGPFDSSIYGSRHCHGQRFMFRFGRSLLIFCSLSSPWPSISSPFSCLMIDILCGHC